MRARLSKLLAVHAARPVSYTHLHQKAEAADVLGVLPNVLTFNIHLAPVSYTHLDVYKRQAVSIKLEPASLMYMSPAIAPMMAFLAFAAARRLEETFAEKAPIEKA